jgi:hypothetical protein
VGYSGLDDWKLLEQMPLAKTLRKEIKIRMDPDFPRDVRLIDVHETSIAFIVSKRLKETLAETAEPYVEFLPITIINHKGREASKDYFVVNVSKPINCLDVKKSKPSYNHIEAGRIDDVESLVLADNKVPKDARLFGVTKFPGPVVVDEALRDTLQQGKFEGLEFMPAEQYTG